MGEVVFLKPKNPKNIVRAQKFGNYYCTICTRDYFKVNEDGSVHCYNCGAHMTNLEVVNKGADGG